MNILISCSQLHTQCKRNASGLNKKEKTFIQKGGHIRGVSDIPCPYIDAVREHLDIGQSVRHSEKYQGVFMVVGDERKSISSMSIDVESLSIDTPLVALWSNDPTYAEYLMSTFKIAWEQSIPAAQRIEEMLNEGPLDV